MANEGPTEPEAMLADLQRTRAFDRPSYEKLLATVEALKATGCLPEHNLRALYSADPDLHVLLADGGWGPMYEAAAFSTSPTGEARRIRRRLGAQSGS